MQCLWILDEEGNQYIKEQNYGKALRRFHQILDVRTTSFNNEVDEVTESPISRD